MPFKYNATRRHRIPRARYRVRNWPAYEAGLKRRGDLTRTSCVELLKTPEITRLSNKSGQNCAHVSDALVRLVANGKLL